MVRRESRFGSRCCGLRHGELPVVRLQFRCRGGAREVQLYGQRAAMITFRSFSANVMVVLRQALIAAVRLLLLRFLDAGDKRAPHAELCGGSRIGRPHLSLRPSGNSAAPAWVNFTRQLKVRQSK